ncbi:BQ5605_C015g07969 [Microbotryum silenes-dioicae]|uniref:BQ5605_C015g07969 protein n=1 Tax=Microbotryum silenes-dioicae TaxID=796604 RepID=A0A2X0LXF5_9BASI|nr:BQ5605_C015g07969 [Microbotryum silenes-dioicae]
MASIYRSSSISSFDSTASTSSYASSSCSPNDVIASDSCRCSRKSSSSPIHSLPFELIHYIIDLTLPSDHSSRTRVLLSYALVSRFFLLPSQSLLNASIKLSTSSAANRWLSSKRPSTTSSSHLITHALSMAGIVAGHGISANTARKCLLKAERVSTVELFDFKSLPVKALQGPSLSNLHTLYLSTSFVPLPRSSFPLLLREPLYLPFRSTLRTLTLSGTPSIPSPLLFALLQCPYLTSLTLSLVPRSSCYPNLIEALPLALGNGLKELAIHHPPDERFLQDAFGPNSPHERRTSASIGASNLTHLSLHPKVPLDILLEKLSASRHTHLQHLDLTISYNVQGMNAILRQHFLVGGGGSFHRLKTLVLRGTREREWDRFAKEEGRWLTQVGSEERRFKVEWIPI